MTNRTQNRQDRTPFVSKRIFNSGRDLVVRYSAYDLKTDEFFKGSGKHCIRDISHLFANETVSKIRTRSKHADDPAFPFPPNISNPCSS